MMMILFLIGGFIEQRKWVVPGVHVVDGDDGGRNTSRSLM